MFLSIYIVPYFQKWKQLRTSLSLANTAARYTCELFDLWSGLFAPIHKDKL